MNTENNTTPDVAAKATKASSFISGLLTGWGVPANVARVIAGAVIGAVCAYFAATFTGCASTYSKTLPDGTTVIFNGNLGNAGVPAVNKSNTK